MAKKRRDGSISFPDMVAGGENENGFVGFTPNDTTHGEEGPGPQEFKYNMKANGQRWAWPDAFDEIPMPMVRAGRKRR